MHFNSILCVDSPKALQQSWVVGFFLLTQVDAFANDELNRVLELLIDLAFQKFKQLERPTQLLQVFKPQPHLEQVALMFDTSTLNGEGVSRPVVSTKPLRTSLIINLVNLP